MCGSFEFTGVGKCHEQGIVYSTYLYMYIYIYIYLSIYLYEQLQQQQQQQQPCRRIVLVVAIEQYIMCVYIYISYIIHTVNSNRSSRLQ